MPTNSQKQIYGVILAGGESKRMGSDKAKLLYQGMPLISHIANIISSIPGFHLSNNLLVSGEINAYTSIPDEYPKMGPVGGIYSIMKYILEHDSNLYKEPSYMLVIPVDMPKLTSGLLAKLLASLENNSPELIHFTGYRLPTIIAVNPDILTILSNLLKPNLPTTRRSLKELYIQLSSRKNTLTLTPPLNTENMFINCNSPKDLATCLG